VATKKHILLFGTEDKTDPLVTQLTQLRYHAVATTSESHCRQLATKGWVDLVILAPPELTSDFGNLCRRLKKITAGRFLPVLILADQTDFTAKVRGLELGADDYLSCPVQPPVLKARIKSLLRVRDLTSQLAKKNDRMTAVCRELETRYAMLDSDLRFAQKLQQSLLPDQFPALNGFAFSGTIIPSTRVAGDFFDIQRLDENNISFYVADVMGHGIGAALLTVFIKKGIRTKDISGNAYRIVSPEEVLAQLSSDLIAQNLSESPFVTICYGVIDTSRGIVTVACGGHPAPVIINRHGNIETVKVGGSLLGIFEDTYESVSLELIPGDKLIVYSDGVENAQQYGDADGMDGFFNCIADNAALPLADLFTKLSSTLFKQSDDEPLRDDVTLAGVEMIRNS